MKLYRYPHQSVSKHTKNHPELQAINDQPQAYWINDWSPATKLIVEEILERSSAKDEVPVFVLYMIPDRDNASHSKGGAKNYKQYKDAVQDFFKMHHRNSIAIFEPDAFALNFSQKRTEVFTEIFHSIRPEKVKVFLDIGHPHWHTSEHVKTMLEKIDIENLAGISINVSNFVSSRECEKYGNKICKKVGAKYTFIVDTSRNGNGSTDDDQWCNPSGRSLGKKPSIIAKRFSRHYANLWIKLPGESDGQCNGGPKAGEFWTEYALDLVRKSKR